MPRIKKTDRVNMKRGGPCLEAGCAQAASTRGLCWTHYDRQRRPRERTNARAHHSVEQRMERWIERDPNSGCWLWSGTLNTRGYGQIAFQGQSIRAHRLAFETWIRPLVGGEVVCHRCDTPACVNPAHLWAGTQSDNMRDMTLKGRGRPHGAESYNIRFCEAA